MKSVLTALALAAGLAVAGAPIAKAHEGHAHAAEVTALTAGEVMKVDQSAGKITIKHGPIKKLDMDESMTMVFKASDPAMLKTVKVGDTIKFVADKVNGQLTVTKIEKAK